MQREELGDLILRLEGGVFPDLEEREAKEFWRSKWSGRVWWIPLIPLTVFLIWIWHELRQLAAQLPPPFAHGDLYFVLAYLVFLAGYIRLYFWLFEEGGSHLDRLSTGTAGVCEGGVWLERLGAGEVAISWSDLEGCRVEPNEPFVWLVPTDAWLEGYEETSPSLALSIPTLTEEIRGALLMEFSRHGLPEF